MSSPHVTSSLRVPDISAVGKGPTNERPSQGRDSLVLSSLLNLCFCDKWLLVGSIYTWDQPLLYHPPLGSLAYKAYHGGRQTDCGLAEAILIAAAL